MDDISTYILNNDYVNILDVDTAFDESHLLICAKWKKIGFFKYIWKKINRPMPSVKLLRASIFMNEYNISRDCGILLNILKHWPKSLTLLSNDEFIDALYDKNNSFSNINTSKIYDLYGYQGIKQCVYDYYPKLSINIIKATSLQEFPKDTMYLNIILPLIKNIKIHSPNKIEIIQTYCNYHKYIAKDSLNFYNVSIKKHPILKTERILFGQGKINYDISSKF